MSKTPLVKTMRLPAARASRTKATSASACSILLEADAAREAPAVARTIDADVLGARLDAEGVEQPVIIVGEAVELVNGDVHLVGAFDQLERLDRERRFGVAAQPLPGELFDRRVGAVTADALGVE